VVLKVAFIIYFAADHTKRPLPTPQQISTIFNKAGGDPNLAPTGSVQGESAQFVSPSCMASVAGIHRTAYACTVRVCTGNRQQASFPFFMCARRRVAQKHIRRAEDRFGRIQLDHD
jgi:hypothetical protein